MTEQFFKEQMKIIFSDFGQTEYTPNRVRIIWEACRDLPEKNFAWIVKTFCRSLSVKYPPVPNDFIEAAHKERQKLNNGYKRDPGSTNEPEPNGEAVQAILKRLGVASFEEAVRKRKAKIV